MRALAICFLALGIVIGPATARTMGADDGTGKAARRPQMTHLQKRTSATRLLRQQRMTHPPSRLLRPWKMNSNNFGIFSRRRRDSFSSKMMSSRRSERRWSRLRRS